MNRHRSYGESQLPFPVMNAKHKLDSVSSIASYEAACHSTPVPPNGRSVIIRSDVGCHVSRFTLISSLLT
jgi:hypothetical protein